MKSIFFFIKKYSLPVLLLVLITACDKEAVRGDGNVVEDRRALEAYTKIDISGEYSIILQQSATPEMWIETDQNLLSLIKTEVKGNTLHINSEEELDASDGITLVISYTDLEELEIGGAVKLRAEEVIKSEKLKIDISGAGWVELELEAEEIKLQLSGASSVTLSGDCEQLEVEMSGAGSLDAYDLHSQNCSVDLSGIGGAKVYATDNLEASVSGVGNVRYKGDPRNLKRSVSGLGNVEPADSKKRNNEEN